jgi:hypothetical protein
MSIELAQTLTVLIVFLFMAFALCLAAYMERRKRR